VSRAKAVELLATGHLQVYVLPGERTELTWHTISMRFGEEANAYLSAMDELRDERWVLVSVFPASDRLGDYVETLVACIHRRVSEAEADEMRRPG